VKPVSSLFLLLLSINLITGCIGIRFLKKDEYLIYKQNIKGTRETSAEELSTLYKQKQNKRIPFIQVSPYIYSYQWGLKSYNRDKLQIRRDTIDKEYERQIALVQNNPRKVNKLRKKKNKEIDKIDKTINEGNKLMRMGEPLAIYDSALCSNTVSQMETYLFTRGYFESTVKMNIARNEKLYTINYMVNEGKPHVVDSIIYSIDDAVVDSLVTVNLKDSYLKKGNRYSQEDLVKERERIELLLQNNGYYAFNRLYITYVVDTSIGDHKIAVKLNISKPDRSPEYKIFKIDSVIFTTDVTNEPLNFKRYSERYNGITYRYIKDVYSKKILDRRVFIFPNRLYSRNNTIETQRQLLNLDNFKFVNINYDTTGGLFIANIFTSPLKKYQATNEVGLEVTQGFPGPFYNLTLKTRNVFGGLENLELTGRVGYEGVASATDPSKIYSSTQAGVLLNLIIPQFIFISKRLSPDIGLHNPKTSLSTGYAYTNRPEYQRNNFSSRISYSWQNDLKRFYNLSFANVSLIKSTLDEEFSKQLDELRKQGNNLWRTFNPSLVLSTSFSVTNNYNQYGFGGNKSAAFWKNYIDLGGTVLNFFPVSYLDSTGLEMYKYVKFSSDFRKYITLTPRTQLAYRVNMGIARSYAANGVIPYEKYFFAGGSNSNRAWRPRRLGPGAFFPSYTDSTGTHYTDKYEQPGEILIETSLEVRTKIIKFVQGAAFIDAGNIWMTEKDPNRPGAEFNIHNFYKEIAIGAGLGLRFDFTFLLLRFDLGFKIYNPALPEGLRFIGQQIGVESEQIEQKYGLSADSLPDLWVFNLAIGYPF
jgi:outer membrane protein insertion porin family